MTSTTTKITRSQLAKIIRKFIWLCIQKSLEQGVAIVITNKNHNNKLKRLGAVVAFNTSTESGALLGRKVNLKKREVDFVFSIHPSVVDVADSYIRFISYAAMEPKSVKNKFKKLKLKSADFPLLLPMVFDAVPVTMRALRDKYKCDYSTLYQKDVIPVTSNSISISASQKFKNLYEKIRKNKKLSAKRSRSRAIAKHSRAFIRALDAAWPKNLKYSFVKANADFPDKLSELYSTFTRKFRKHYCSSFMHRWNPNSISPTCFQDYTEIQS